MPMPQRARKCLRNKHFRILNHTVSNPSVALIWSPTASTTALEKHLGGGLEGLSERHKSQPLVRQPNALDRYFGEKAPEENG
jgi:hypothetical protein